MAPIAIVRFLGHPVRVHSKGCGVEFSDSDDTDKDIGSHANIDLLLTFCNHEYSSFCSLKFPGSVFIWTVFRVSVWLHVAQIR